MKKVILFVLVFILGLNSVLATVVSAESSVLIDAETLEILYGKDENAVMSMASTTKIMTAIIALENADLTREIEVKLEYALVEGSSMYLKEGEIISMTDLLYGLMLMSGNDAALAIAYETTGDFDEFISLMNEKAQELGLENTNFENPNGLDSQNHHTTAYELAKLTAYALQNEQFVEIVSSKTYETESRTMQNHNKMLWFMDEAIGVKTGYTQSSGRCLVSAATIDGKTLIAVTLDAPSDWADHQAMYDYGFDLYDVYHIQSAGSFYGEVCVYGGDKEKVNVVFEQDLNLNLTALQKDNLTYYISSKKIHYSPIKKDEIYGEIVYNIGNNEIYRGNLIFSEDVGYEYIPNMNIYEKFIDFIKNLFY